jgi:hypothetical protein
MPSRQKLEARRRNKYTGFVVLTAVIMKTAAFCCITQCEPLKSTDVSEERNDYAFRV